ncbi:hypothetical protein RFI_27170, partial [Reticulomyxa filosa]
MKKLFLSVLPLLPFFFFWFKKKKVVQRRTSLQDSSALSQLTGSYVEMGSGSATRESRRGENNSRRGGLKMGLETSTLGGLPTVLSNWMTMPSSYQSNQSGDDLLVYHENVNNAMRGSRPLVTPFVLGANGSMLKGSVQLKPLEITPIQTGHQHGFRPPQHTMYNVLANYERKHEHEHEHRTGYGRGFSSIDPYPNRPLLSTSKASIAPAVDGFRRVPILGQPPRTNYVNVSAN